MRRMGARLGSIAMTLAVLLSAGRPMTARGQAGPIYQGVFASNVITVSWSGVCLPTISTNYTVTQGTTTISLDQTAICGAHKFTFQGTLQVDFPPVTPDATISFPGVLNQINWSPGLQCSATFDGQWQFSGTVSGNKIELISSLGLSGDVCPELQTPTYGPGLSDQSYPVMLTQTCSTSNQAFPAVVGTDLIYGIGASALGYVYTTNITTPDTQITFLFLDVTAEAVYLVPTAAWIVVDTNKVHFDIGSSSPVTNTVSIINTGTANLNFSVGTNVTSGGNWLSVSPSQGTLTPSQSTNLSVSVDVTSLAPDQVTNTGQILIFGNSSKSPQSILVETVQTNLGHIFCLCNSNGIPGASIQFGTNLITAGGDGSYSLASVAPGTYDVTVSAANFLSLSTNITIKAKQKVPDFYLTNTTFIITPVLDASITGRPDSDAISNSILAATREYSQYIADPICVKILFANINEGLGQSVTPVSNLTYSTYVADLKASTNLSANDLAALATLNPPPDTGLLGNTMVSLTAANLEAIGEHDMADDLTKGNAGFNSKIQFNFSIMNTSRPDKDPTLYDLQSTALHEIDEVLGIGGNASTLFLTKAYSGQTGPTDGVGPLDLYRYKAPGLRSFSLSPNVKAYFSINGGTSVLVSFNQEGWTSSGSSADFGDWGDGVVPADGEGNTNSMVQDAVGTPGAAEDLGANEVIALDVVGYTLITKSTILNFVHLGGPTFKFAFATAPGQTYQVQSTASLNPPISWTNLGPPFLAADITSAFTDTNAMGIQLYYRVNALPSTNHAAAVVIHQQPAIAPSGSSPNPIIRRHVIVPRDR